jgi:hypothetical protein
LGKFWTVLQWKVLVYFWQLPRSILRPFGKFCVNFGTFDISAPPPFWNVVPIKIWLHEEQNPYNFCFPADRNRKVPNSFGESLKISVIFVACQNDSYGTVGQNINLTAAKSKSNPSLDIVIEPIYIEVIKSE